MTHTQQEKKFLLKKALYIKALSQLQKALDQPKSEYLRDAVIQRFEFTYELAWKTLKIYLETIDLLVLNPKETLKVAYQQGILADADAWSELHMNRNLTSHTYDEQLAEDIYAFLKTKGLALFLELKDKLETVL